MYFSILAIVLSLVLVFAQDQGATMSGEGPIEIDGDPVSRIVASTTAGDPRVAGDDGLYEHSESGWSKVAPSPPLGRLVGGGTESGLMMAGDHEPCGRGGSSMVLQRSADNGQTWSPVDGADGYRPLAIWPGTGLAFAGSCLGLHVSLDDGLTWSPVEGVEPGWEVTSFATVPQSDDRVPVALVGLTGEGGTSYLRSIDFTDPAAPVVSGDLRMYYAIGGLAGVDDTYVLAVFDGVWISDDAGATWKQSRTGLEDVTLERDPAEFGLPADLDPANYGLTSVVLLPGEEPGLPGMIVGSADGLYIAMPDGDGWSRIEGTSGKVDIVLVSGDGSLAVYETEDGVHQVSVDTGS